MQNLKNSYYLQRHAQSIPNKSGIIVSNLESGIDARNGLSEIGKEQAFTAISKCIEEDIFSRSAPFIVVSSPFSRTKETAQISIDILKEYGYIIDEYNLEPRLRERYFGEFEKDSSDRYVDVWNEDAKSTCHTQYNVESVDAVLERMLDVIHHLEKTYHKKQILISSHGDPLNIFFAHANNLPIGEHQYCQAAMQNAEIRKWT